MAAWSADEPKSDQVDEGGTAVRLGYTSQKDEHRVVLEVVRGDTVYREMRRVGERCRGTSRPLEQLSTSSALGRPSREHRYGVSCLSA